MIGFLDGLLLVGTITLEQYVRASFKVLEAMRV